MSRWSKIIGSRQVNIVGRTNHGKTLLIEELIGYLRAAGLKVGSVKHSAHAHLLEPPGKDTARHRRAGASPAAIITPELGAIFIPTPPDGPCLDPLVPLYQDCDLVLVEGFLSSPHPLKIEVWRAEQGGQPLACQHGGILAVVTHPDTASELPVPIWDRRDLSLIARNTLALVGLEDHTGAAIASRAETST